MRDFIIRFWTNIAGRLVGPMQFRLVLQPAAAILFAVRAGIRDARAGHAPYLWALLVGARERRELLREAVTHVGRVFVLGLVMDAIYQAIELGTFYPGEAIVVATLLAIVPYIVLRGPIARLMRRVIKRRE
jgi:hypothetical protein